jgi:ATP-dependent DNA ligase
MSISCGRRTDYLKLDCESKGITVTPAGRKLMKDDYVRALREWHLNHKYGSKDNIPWHLRFMLSIESLQLCRRIKDLKPEQQRLVWESDDWIAEPKIDGCRCAILWDAAEKKFHFYSRNNSVEDYLPQDYSDTIYVTSKNFCYKDNFVLDCEVISTDPNAETNIQCLTQLQSTAALLALNPEDSKKIQKRSPLKFIVFDCLYNKEECMSKPWTVRHKYASDLCAELVKSGFCCELNQVIENTEDNKFAKREFYDSYVAQGGEGCVLKNRNAVYHATSSRTIDCVKVKRSTSDSIANDIDAFITDYVVGNDDTRNQNMIVGFVFSVKMKKDNGQIVTHHIATCSNVSDFIKEDATISDTYGNIKLNPDYYGRVATIQGQNVSARSLRLTHAVIDCWRPERSADSCEILNESDLRKMIF